MLRLPPEQRDTFIDAELRELGHIAEMGLIEGVAPIQKRIQPFDSRMVYNWKNAVPQEGAHQFGKGSGGGWSKERPKLSKHFFMFVLLT